MPFDAETTYSELRPHFRERVRRNEPLARHGTFGVGGPADIWVSLDTVEELMSRCDCALSTGGSCCWLAMAQTYSMLMPVREELWLALHSTPIASKIMATVRRSW